MIRKILSILLVIVWLTLIFGFSSDNGENSTSLTEKVITGVVEVFTPIEKNSEEMDKIIEVSSMPVRKCAHFFLYFTLGFLMMNCLYILGFKRNTIIIACVFAILVAISDEFHQTFVDGRVGSVVDVLLDSSGSLICSVLYHHFVIMRSYYVKKN